MNENTEIFICDCGSFEHQAIFWHDKEWDNQIYIYIHLTTYQNFFLRLWAGLRYAFGFTSRFGEWDQFILSREDENRLFEYLKKKQESV